MHPAPDTTLPDDVFTTYDANVSMVWPQQANPFERSPVRGLTEAQWVARDILRRGRQGIPTILPFGFVDRGLDLRTIERNLKGWAHVLRATGAEPYILALVGIDDSNCLLFRPQAAAAHKREIVTELLMDEFPNVKLRGHVFSIARWGRTAGVRSLAEGLVALP